MQPQKVKLFVIAGPDAGLTFDIPSNCFVGRDANCTVVLSDPTVSSVHARLDIEPVLQVMDLNSANHTYVNGQQVKSAPLQSGDILGFGGGTQIRVEVLKPIDETEAKLASRKRVLIYIVALVVMLLLGVLYLNMQVREARYLGTVPLSAPTMTRERAFTGVMTVRLPKDEEYVPPLVPSPNNATFLYLPKWLVDPRPQNAIEFDLSPVLPPDPPERVYAKTRPWAERPPRLGSGRLVQGQTQRQTFVLGNYFLAEYSYQNGVLADAKPMIGAPAQPIQPLNFVFCVQAWDGVPRDADLSWFSLDRPEYRNGAPTKRPSIPRRYGFIVPDSLWTTRTETVQAAHVARGTRNTYVRLEKKGEVLYYLTFDYPKHQKPRLEALAKQLLESQDLPGRARGYTTEEYREMAGLLEREADQMLPDLMAWNLDDFERHDRKEDFLRAASRYMKAMEFRQVAGDWLNNEDYERLTFKMLAINSYFENDRSLFQRLFLKIEDGLVAHTKRRSLLAPVREDVQTLRDIAIKGTDLQLKYTLASGREATISLNPDEWLIYARLRTELLKGMEEE